MTQITLAIGLMLLSPGPSTASWTLVPCDRTHAAQWQAHERTVRRAQPGSLHYRPKPFPKNSEELIEDFLYEYHRIFDNPAEVPADMRRIYDGIQQNTLRFEVVRVENWTPLRCGKREESPFDYLIRIFSVVDGVELARMTVSDSGYIRDMSVATEKQPHHSWPVLNDVLARVRSDVGIQGTIPQYVLLVGWPRMCDYGAPCVAFRWGADTYIMSYRRELFLIPAAARRLSTERELKNPDKSVAIAALGLKPSEGIISLGGTVFAVARRVEPKQDR